MQNSILFFSLLIIFSAGIAFAQENGQYKTNDSLAEAERAFAQMSVAIGQKEAFLEFLGDKGLMFNPDPITAKDLLGGQPPTVQPQERVLDWEPIYGDVSTGDDFGFNFGPWLAYDNKNPQKKVLGRGYFLSIWKRMADGNWKVIVDAGTRVPPSNTEHKLGLSFKLDRDLKKSSQTQSTKYDKNSVFELERKFMEITKTQGLFEAYSKSLDNSTLVMRFNFGAIWDLKSVGDYLKNNQLEKLSLELSPVDGEVSRAGDLAYSYGKYQLGGNDAVKEKGYYVHIWRFNEKTGWKIAVENLLPDPSFINSTK